MARTDSDTIKYLENEIGQQEEELNQWLPLYYGIQRWVYPNRADILTKIMKGSSLTKQIFDTTPVKDCQKLANGFFTYNCGLTQQSWFGFESPYAQINERDEVQLYFSMVNTIVMLELISSNFLLQGHLDVYDKCSYGTSCTYLDYSNERDGLFFKAFPIYDFMFRCNEWDEPEYVYVRYEMTPQEIVDRFGINAVSEQTKKKHEKQLKQGGQADTIKVYHCVGPRKVKTTLAKQNPRISKDFPYYSIYYEPDAKHAISIGGYKSQPYIISRFGEKIGEGRGRSPAINAIPDIQDVNYTRYMLKLALGKHVNPPSFFPKGGVFDLKKLNLDMGGRNWYNPVMGNEKPFYFRGEGDLPSGWNELKEIRQDIHEHFYIDMFEALGERKNMTAQEVVVRVEEQRELFSPIQGRIQEEYFKPLLTRVFELLWHTGKIPPPPPILQQFPEYKIVYRSKLAMSIRNIQTAGFAKTMNLALPLLQAQPQLLSDNFDVDRILRDIGMNEGMPSNWLIPFDRMMQIRVKRQKEMAERQQMEMLAEGAKTLPALTKGAEPNSPMAMLQGAANG